MNQNRVEQLQKFIQDDPSDPFPKYALALEFLQMDKPKSVELFQNLLENHAGYLPSYYHAALLFTELGQDQDAEITFKKGIDLAKIKDDQHALKELQNAYQNFLFED